MSGDFISREAAISALRLVEVRESFYNFPAGMLSELKSIPAADVVEVVRCRECEFTYEWHGRLYCKRLRDRWNHVNDLRVDDTDFCTWGKRKDGGQDDA